MKNLRRTKGGDYMALEVNEISAYQNDIGPVVKSRDVSGKKIDMAVDSVGSTYQAETEYNQEKEINEEYIREEIAKANNYLKKNNIKCIFDYHEETNRITIKVMDRDTKEIIREIPPEKTLDAIKKMWKLAGLLIDERR